MRNYNKSLGVLAVVVLLVAGVSAPITAHESQTVKNYDLTFGGTDEPLITGERMWLEFEIVNNKTGEPVANQSETLNITVQKMGNGEFTLDVSEKHGEPGVYETPVIFTEPGKYMVHVRGTLDGTEIHTHFETTVHDHTKLQYIPESHGNTTQSQSN